MPNSSLPSSCAPAQARPSLHRAPVICLPQNAATAAALVRQYVLSGDTAFDRSSAIEAMNERLGRLRDDNDEQVFTELAGQASVCDALFQRWTTEAMAARDPDHKAKFMKLALASQASYTRTMIAVEGLRAQRKGKAAVTVIANDSGSGPDDDFDDAP